MNREKIELAVAKGTAMATVKTERAVRKAAKAICARKLTRYAFSLAAAMMCVGTTVFAAGNDATTQVNSMITTINGWITTIGGVIIGFGAVTTGLGIANQDDAGRNKGLMTMAGGAVVMGISIAVGSGGGASTPTT